MFLAENTWICVHETVRVRVFRPFEHIIRRAKLQESACVHYADYVTYLGDNRHVVRNVNHAHINRASYFLYFPKDLVLHNYVQGSRRLVRNYQAWITRKCHGDNGALFHAAAVFMWIVIHAFLRDSN